MAAAKILRKSSHSLGRSYEVRTWNQFVEKCNQEITAESSSVGCRENILFSFVH